MEFDKIDGKIYKITNKINGKRYIGQTTDKLNVRWSNHCSSSSRCLGISSAIKKYGRDSFTVELEGTYDNQVDLDNAEEYFVDFYNSVAPNGYNLKSGGGRGTIVYSEETRARMSANMKGKPSLRKGKKMSAESIAKMSASRMGKSPVNKGKPMSDEQKLLLSKVLMGRAGPVLGRKQSEESRLKISISQSGKNNHNFGKPRSEETKKKISDSHKKNKVLCITNGIEYDSISSAARSLGLNPGSIHQVLSGRSSYAKGYVFKKT